MKLRSIRLFAGRRYCSFESCFPRRQAGSSPLLAVFAAARSLPDRVGLSLLRKAQLPFPRRSARARPPSTPRGERPAQLHRMKTRAARNGERGADKRCKPWRGPAGVVIINSGSGNLELGLLLGCCCCCCCCRRCCYISGLSSRRWTDQLIKQV